MSDPKAELEIQKLGHEVENSRREARRPWLLTVSVPTPIASLVSGAGGYIFGESASDKARAETRVQVLKQYFDVDNRVIGKRQQMLLFIERTLAQDDPDLAAWVRLERFVLRQTSRDVAAERIGSEAQDMPL